MLAVALPVLIHLLGRRKRRTVGFATLRFLERAAARASARWRLRRLLLLLARMLAIAALVALFAGPGWQSAEEGAAQLKVLVVDTSLSMSAATDGTTPFERGKAALAELIGEASPLDRFILLSSAAGATAGRAGGYSDDSDDSSGSSVSSVSGVSNVSNVSGVALLDSVEAASRVAALKMTAHDAGLVRALEKANAAVAGARLGSELGSAQLVVVTDMQRHAWRELEGMGGSETPLTLIDVGADAAVNSWVEKIVQRDTGFEVELGGIKGSGASAQAGEQAERKVVFSYGDAGAGGKRQSLTAFVDGEHAVFTPAYGTVDEQSSKATAKTTAETTVATVKAGLVPGGALAFDDELELVANPSGPVDVLLVNGDPRGFEIRDELLFMRRALGSGGKLSKRFVVKEIRQTELSKMELERFEVVWLANPSTITGEVAQMLAARVEEGMGVVVSAGGQWRPERSGDFLLTLLASPLRDRMTISGEDSTRPPFETPDAASLGGPLYAFGEGGERGEGGREAELLSAVRVTGYWLADVGLGEQIKVWARLSNKAPLLVERTAGNGRYLLLTTSVDRDWSDLCLSPIFLPFLEKVITHAAGRTRSGLPDYLTAGTGLASPFSENTRLEGPDGAVQKWTPGRSDVSLERTGVYRVFTDDAARKPLGGFVVRVETAESELARFSAGELSALGGEGVLSLGGDANKTSLGRRDLSRWAAFLLLFALAAEALLSARWPRRKHIRLESDDVG
jgi:hypothetical protein